MQVQLILWDDTHNREVNHFFFSHLVDLDLLGVCLPHTSEASVAYVGDGEGV